MNDYSIRICGYFSTFCSPAISTTHADGGLPASLQGISTSKIRKASSMQHVLADRVSLNPIIEKDLAVAAACSRDSRLQGACAHWGAAARPDLRLTSGEFRKQYEIVIAACNSCGEMDCRGVINATVGLTIADLPTSG
jgi:hypothetical protein